MNVFQTFPDTIFTPKEWFLSKKGPKEWREVTFIKDFWLVVDRHKLTVFYLKSFDMDSVQVGKAVFSKEIHTTLGIEPRTILQSGEVRQPF